MYLWVLHGGMRGWLSCALWFQGLGHLQIWTSAWREGVLQPVPHTRGIRGMTVMSALGSSSPFPTYPSSSIFFPSLSPTPSFKAHSTCSGPYCSDGVKEQSRWWRTVDIIMLLVTVILKHLVLNVLSSPALQPSLTFKKNKNKNTFILEYSWLPTLWWFEMDNIATQPYIYMEPFSPKLPSHPGYRMTLSRGPCPCCQLNP